MVRTPIHRGETLAGVIEAPPNRHNQILAGMRNVTADTAARLSQYPGVPLFSG